MPTNAQVRRIDRVPLTVSTICEASRADVPGERAAVFLRRHAPLPTPPPAVAGRATPRAPARPGRGPAGAHRAAAVPRRSNAAVPSGLVPGSGRPPAPYGP